MHPYIHAQKNPQKPAYIVAGSGETVTYRQLDANREPRGAPKTLPASTLVDNFVPEAAAY